MVPLTLQWIILNDKFVGVFRMDRGETLKSNRAKCVRIWIRNRKNRRRKKRDFKKGKREIKRIRGWGKGVHAYNHRLPFSMRLPSNLDIIFLFQFFYFYVSSTMIHLIGCNLFLWFISYAFLESFWKIWSLKKWYWISMTSFCIAIILCYYNFNL